MTGKETDCAKCETQIRKEVVKRIERLMIPCWGGNKLLLAKDLKALREGEVTLNGKNHDKEI